MITIVNIYKSVDTCVISTTAVCAFPDLAVGAPYGGEEGRGVVYIYVGSMDGIITEVSQVLQGKDMGYQLSTFGFSISGGHDLDQNGYSGKIDLLYVVWCLIKVISLLWWGHQWSFPTKGLHV